MADYLTEQEQIEQLKGWIKQYGLTVLLGIGIALIITTGWRYWQGHRQQILQTASMGYDEMLMQRAQNNNTAIAKAKVLVRDYPKTAYADMAAMLLARNAVLKKDYPEAITQLTWTIDHSHVDINRTIARTRLARIFITENKPDDALNVLNQIEDKNYSGLIDSLRGDAYLAKKDPVSARKYYQLALKELPNAEVSQPILEMKFNNLNTNNTTVTP